MRYWIAAIFILILGIFFLSIRKSGFVKGVKTALGEILWVGVMLGTYGVLNEVLSLAKIISLFLSFILAMIVSYVLFKLDLIELIED